MIVKCDCKNTTQDSFHGVDNRVHNPMHKDNRVIGWRCTVCGKEKLQDGKKREVQPQK